MRILVPQPDFSLWCFARESRSVQICGAWPALWLRRRASLVVLAERAAAWSYGWFPGGTESQNVPCVDDTDISAFDFEANLIRRTQDVTHGDSSASGGGQRHAPCRCQMNQRDAMAAALPLLALGRVRTLRLLAAHAASAREAPHESVTRSGSPPSESAARAKSLLRLLTSFDFSTPRGRAVAAKVFCFHI